MFSWLSRSSRRNAVPSEPDSYLTKEEKALFAAIDAQITENKATADRIIEDSQRRISEL